MNFIYKGARISAEHTVLTLASPMNMIWGFELSKTYIISQKLFRTFTSQETRNLKNQIREEILGEVQKKAFEYEKNYYGCSQCVLLAVQEIFGLESEETFKAATGFAGGIGFKGSVCGALIGGITAIGLKYGRDIQSFLKHDPEKTRFKTFNLARKLWEKFEETYGSCACHDIQKKIFGNSYNLWDPKQYEEFEKDGGHGSNGCPTVVKNAAKWVAEFFLEEK